VKKVLHRVVARIARADDEGMRARRRRRPTKRGAVRAHNNSTNTYFIGVFSIAHMREQNRTRVRDRVMRIVVNVASRACRRAFARAHTQFVKWNAAFFIAL